MRLGCIQGLTSLSPTSLSPPHRRPATACAGRTGTCFCLTIVRSNNTTTTLHQSQIRQAASQLVSAPRPITN
ncbi:uncharacterized protein K460DRAFT_171139 [Cucurbitaria berberidis CBS 394.84]|uniref:Uncharacterized protein n=1 Tax=Cucurbitaria berberidis CBS 394.84 TaxID=1168544 RepID=A0A9P4G9K2_9PLEO|nr:uncharacterized protein K460DRAFT_171139 [Cucurbitaria berberidis CBS 394.84]KAF1841678.1 hypothetical protein K460DRAFT_171139 [Cucurbitaria berberidis CBS 394.84]